MNILVFVLPFAVLLLLTIGWRRPLWQAAMASYVTGVVISSIARGFEMPLLAVPMTHAFFIAVELAVILFGAIFFLNFLKINGAIDKIQGSLNSVTSDKRLQAILLAWLFGGFIEGASGFGTPAMIVAPLLASLGFPLMVAVVLPLMANTTAVTFGAVGTPVKIGFAGIESANAAGVFAASVNLLAGLLVPLFILFFVVRFTGGTLKKDFKQAVPFALWAGLCFLVPYFLLSFAGVEFPSMAGGLLGLFLCIISIRYKFLVPETQTGVSKPDLAGLVKAFMPYTLLCVLLVVGKLVFRNVIILDLWYEATRNFAVFQPGMAFLTAILVLYLISPKFRSSKIKIAALDAFKVLPKPWVAIFFIAALAQNLLFVGREFSVIWQLTPYLSEAGVLFTAVAAGTFGSFAAGSATVSNLLFGREIYEAALAAGAGAVAALGMQLIGSGIGNALALQNIAVVQAAVKMEGEEKNILRQVVIPCMIYLVVAFLAGMLILNLTRTIH
ncbi:L-lactate permease [Cytophagaceae bacterium ABcell3]|nr:L-lactate permease [Cytophagaceae bacterium ABcell3]